MVKRKIITRICQNCGKQFHCHKPSGKDKKLFCSRHCFYQYRKNLPEHWKPCIVCGKKFWVIFPSYYKNGCLRTCSKECSHILRVKAFDNPRQHAIRVMNGKRNGSKSHPERRVFIHKTCKQCSKPYILTGKADHSRRANSNFCSHDCWYEFIRKDRSKHPNWKGGYSPFYGPNWEKQKRIARKRDNYTCQKCRKVESPNSPTLHVHHVKPFRLFGIERYQEANDLSNLITLCSHCHKVIERKCN